MKERFVNVFEKTLAANRGGEIRNILIADNSAEFLNDALYKLRRWSAENRMNLVELDERDDSWLSEIQSRELFDKLNQPNTVLLIKNYATVSYMRGDDNTPRNFLRDAVMNRHYGCGNDFEPSDELSNLMFVVALNDRSLMHWFEHEYSYFTVMLEDKSKAFYMDTSQERRSSKMCPVLSKVNRQIYFASEDCKVLSIDVGKAFGRIHAIRYRSPEDRTDMIHSYINNNIPYFFDKVKHLIIKIDRIDDSDRFLIDAARLRDPSSIYSNKRFIIDAERLRESFPNLTSIDCSHVIEVSNANESIEVCDPFELGELAFTVAREGDFETANFLTRRLWELDTKWAKFYREVAVDYHVPREQHERCYRDGNVKNTGLDKLFRIYLLGWYSVNGDFDNESIVYAKEHKNIDKAVQLLAERFKNWEIDEVYEKLYEDLRHVEEDEKYYKSLVEYNRCCYCDEDEDDYDEEEEYIGYSGFMRTLIATDHLYPGTLDKFYGDGVISRIQN